MMLRHLRHWFKQACFHAEDDEVEVSICYTRRAVNAATKRGVPLGGGFLHVTIPDATKEVSAGAFQTCQQVVVFFIPDSVTRIGNSAFAFLYRFGKNRPSSFTDRHWG